MQTTTCERGHPYKRLGYTERLACSTCDLLELVALAYGDCQQPPRAVRLLDFKSEDLRDWEILCAAIEKIGPYNLFRPELVLRELEPLFSRLMGIQIGREGSPVIYVSIPYWTHQSIGWTGSGMGERIPEGERLSLSKEFLRAMERAEADELTDLGYRLRAWWD